MSIFSRRAVSKKEYNKLMKKAYTPKSSMFIAIVVFVVLITVLAALYLLLK